MLQWSREKYRKISHHKKSVPRHAKICQKEPRPSCVDCIKRLNHYALKRHLIICKGEKVDIKCETCHKKFKTKWLLTCICTV